MQASVQDVAQIFSFFHSSARKFPTKHIDSLSIAGTAIVLITQNSFGIMLKFISIGSKHTHVLILKWSWFQEWFKYEDYMLIYRGIHIHQNQDLKWVGLSF